jgi:CBS domain-containing protein
MLEPHCGSEGSGLLVIIYRNNQFLFSVTSIDTGQRRRLDMRNVTVKELMIRIEEYATVTHNDNLHDAILLLEKFNLSFEQSQHKNQLILVLDKGGAVAGKITMKDILIALEPNYKNLDGMEVLSRSGFSSTLIKSMLETNALWLEPLEFICARASRLKVKDLVSPTENGEYIDKDATLGEAVHQLIISPFIALLVTNGSEVVGVLRLSDVFAIICQKIQTCEV